MLQPLDTPSPSTLLDAAVAMAQFLTTVLVNTPPLLGGAIVATAAAAIYI